MQSEGEKVAIRHLPASANEIQQRAVFDEVFRGICEDLAAAEAALAAVSTLPAAIRAERASEYLGLIDELLAEISLELARAKVVPNSSGKPYQHL
jgi:hypothetical protein